MIYYQLIGGRATGHSISLAPTDPIPPDYVCSETAPRPGDLWDLGTWVRDGAMDFSPQVTADDRYQAAMAQQLKSCDSNKVSLLTSIKLLSQITGTPPKPKAAAALTWWATLWADRNARDAENAQNADFSGHGDCPYSYQELLDESQS